MMERNSSKKPNRTEPGEGSVKTDDKPTEPNGTMDKLIFHTMFEYFADFATSPSTRTKGWPPCYFGHEAWTYRVLIERMRLHCR